MSQSNASTSRLAATTKQLQRYHGCSRRQAVNVQREMRLRPELSVSQALSHKENNSNH